MNAPEPRQKDLWDKLEVIGKSVTGVLVSGAIAFYATYTSHRQFEISEMNRTAQKARDEEGRKAQILMQTIASRESAAADLKAKMFATLMGHFLSNPEDLQAQGVLLEVIGMNFQEHLRLKPLFEKLDREISDEDTREGLRKSARNMARLEIANIEGNGGNACDLELALGKTRAVDERCQVQLSVTLLEMNKNDIRVATNDDNKDGFSVSYFDMPLVDNTTIGDYTYSIILSGMNMDEGKASIRVVILPAHYYSARDGLYFDQLIGTWLVDDHAGR